MSTPTMADPEAAVKQASAHLYEAMTHHYGPLDLAAHQPLVKAHFWLIPQQETRFGRVGQ